LRYNIFLGCIGGLFLCYLGFVIYKSHVVSINKPEGKSSIWYAFFSTCLLTLMSPSTILPFAAVLTNFNSAINTSMESLSFVAGVFLGAALWFCMLSAVVSICRTRITPALLSIVNKVSGIAIIAFGIYSIISALYLFSVAHV
jgi:threonine/homoserine/homoserine lactone efflux protein